ncbi:MAG TPA: hypothetical protein VFY10_07825, partial [Dehalococcoidia bacterium]|nr:hypothetical protein [Dehalococcoidia bacterium]
MPRFDPFALGPSASLNRTRFAEASFIDAELHGVPAYDMLSAQALRRQISTEATALHLDTSVEEDADLLQVLDACSVSPDGAVRATAWNLAGRFGRHLAFLLLTLVTPAAPSSLPADVADYRSHWTTIRHVFLGGGVVSGRIGPVICEAAIDTLRDAGRPDLRLEVAPNAAVLPLIGAARGTQIDAPVALVADFGSTSVKFAYAACNGAMLASLQVLPPIPSPSYLRDEPTDPQRLAGFVTATMAEAWKSGRKNGLQLSSEVSASLAAYVDDGHPMEYGSNPGYYALRRLGTNASAVLSQRLTAAVGQPVRVVLGHDGTIAARALAGA